MGIFHTPKHLKDNPLVGGLDLERTTCFRMVYYNDIARAYFVRNINTLKMNENFYEDGKQKEYTKTELKTTKPAKYILSKIKQESHIPDRHLPDPFDNNRDTTVLDEHKEVKTDDTGNTGNTGNTGKKGSTDE